eukprot:CAMPEP_0172487586 /NCGR_PEP_ID=MMETSP1066-20121228/16721_1 /TAXON_ID=671091 /ORGANISM="Coscinodiscus wailesii, Strain CCMP2513" /LENGTH=580 /DNA_ID=CAMNT_0013254289 /DNA_START=93 /DNA_END=1835 /DNA_ORIENTATION=+
MSLTKVAKLAVAECNIATDLDNESAMKIAKTFFTETCSQEVLTTPQSVINDTDRLVKAGRRIVDILSWSTESTPFVGTPPPISVETALRHLVTSLEILSALPVKVPKTRFGKTNLDMPIVTLGGMRLQQAWGPAITSIDQVTPECQENLVAIIRRALALGVNHIETARGYGCSEMQYGVALKGLFESGEVRREDLIIQTKIPAQSTAKEFRKMLEESLERLQLDYIDLFAFHGVNDETAYKQIFENGDDGNCMDVAKEFVAAGKIRHIGFSTHGSADLIRKCIMTDAFSYVNLHYHFCGSYTATGQSPSGCGNAQNIALMNEKDMGVFIISPYDKGGALYAPSKKLRGLILPDMDPIGFGSTWLWCHDQFGTGKIHTIVCGAARASDFDEVYVAAVQHATEGDEVTKRLAAVRERLDEARVKALGKDWLNTWHEGLKMWNENRYGIHFPQIVGLYNVIKAWGMLNYAKERYTLGVGYVKKWDMAKSPEENAVVMNWGWTPGCALQEGINFDECFVNCPMENREKLVDALHFVHRLCTASSGCASKEKDEKKMEDDKTEEEKIGYEQAYDLRPWTAFPERK